MSLAGGNKPEIRRKIARMGAEGSCGSGWKSSESEQAKVHSMEMSDEWIAMTTQGGGRCQGVELQAGGTLMKRHRGATTPRVRFLAESLGNVAFTLIGTPNFA
jgi:hypothetical protein